MCKYSHALPSVVKHLTPQDSWLTNYGGQKKELSCHMYKNGWPYMYSNAEFEN